MQVKWLPGLDVVDTGHGLKIASSSSIFNLNEVMDLNNVMELTTSICAFSKLVAIPSPYPISNHKML